MRKQITLLAAALLALPLAGKTIDANQAAQKAAQFLSGRSALRSAQDLELVYTGQSESQLRAGETPSYYIYNVKNGTGFVIVSGDDVARPILGYSFQNSFSADVPENVKALLGRYDKQIRWAQANGLKSDGQDIFPNPDEGKLLETALWNQDGPYNWEMPILTNSKGQPEQAVTGCVATAAGIIMEYHHYPTKFKGGEVTWMSGEDEMTVNMDEYTFDWSKMLTAYLADQEGNPQFTEEQGDEVAKLMMCIGAGVNMGYDVAENGGSGANDNDLHDAWIDYFQYPSARMVDRDELSDAAFQRILHEEIDANRPMGYSSGSGSHIFVCDGYGSDGYYHFNMGWGGIDNGYYPIDAIQIEEQGGIGSSTTTKDYSGQITLHYNLIPSAEETPIDYFTYFQNDFAGDDDEEEEDAPTGIFLTDPSATIEQGKPFEIDLLCVAPKTGNGNEKAQIAVAHLSADGQIKELVCTPQNETFQVDFNGYREFALTLQQYPEEQREQALLENPALYAAFQILASEEDKHFQALTCQINQPIEAGDGLMGVASQDGGKHWLPILSIVNAEGKKYSPDTILLTVSTANASIEAAATTQVYVAEGKLCMENAEGEVKVYTATGACVVTQTVNGSARMTLPKGAYFVQIGQQVKKIIL